MIVLFLKLRSYQVGLVVVTFSSLTFRRVLPHWQCVCPQKRVIKCCGMSFGGSMVFFRIAYLFQQTMYFGDDPDPIFRFIRSTVYSRTELPGLCERLRLLDGDKGTSEAEFACGHVRA